MGKPILIKFAAIGAGIFLLTGYFGLQQWADGKADREVKRALIDVDLDRMVRYGSASASLLGRSVALSDVSIRLPEGRSPTITVKKVIISDIETYRDDLSSVRLKLVSLSAPVTDLAKDFRKGAQDRSFDQIVGMGYPIATGNAEIFFRLDPDKQRGTIELATDLDELGSASFKVVLERLDPRLGDIGRQVRGAIKAQNLSILAREASGLIDSVSRVELADLGLTIRDRGIRKRLLAEIAEDGLITDGPERVAMTVAASTAKNVRDHLDNLHVDPRMASDIATKVGQYVESGGELKFTTKIDRPIPLFERGGFLGIQPSPLVTSLDRFLMLAGVRIER